MASLKLTVPCVAIFLLLGLQPLFQEEISLIAPEGISHQLYSDSRVSFILQPNANNRGYRFCNPSLKTIHLYRLGCIVQNNGTTYIVSQKNLHRSEIAGVEENSSYCHLWSGNHGFFPGEACNKGKLGVVEVTFKDGTTWQLAEELTRLGEKVEEENQPSE